MLEDKGKLIRRVYSGWGENGVELNMIFLYLQLKKSVSPGSNSRSLENEAHGIGNQEASLSFQQRRDHQQITRLGKRESLIPTTFPSLEKACKAQ